MEDFKTIKKEEKNHFVVEMLRTVSDSTGKYVYSVERYSTVAYLETLDQKIYRTLRGAENKYNEWVRTHIRN